MTGPTVKVVQIALGTEAEMDATLYAITSKGWRLINVLPLSRSDFFLAFFERATTKGRAP
jgi:hypothetical protein